MEPKGSPKVVDPTRLASVQKIGDLQEPYDFSSAWKTLFTNAMLESIEWHKSGSEFYRNLIHQSGFKASQVKSIKDCDKIPFVPANFFKMHEILSVPKEKNLMHFTSSGTTGQKSQIFFDDWSFRAGQRMVDSVFKHNGFITPETQTNYLLYSYETEADSKLGTAYTDNYLCKYAPIQDAFCALRRTGSGSHDFDVFGCIARLQRYETEGLPVRIFGFPAFLYFTLNRMRSLKERKLKLPPDSLVFLGGGWKGHANSAVPKEELYSLITQYLGIPSHRIRDSFGAVEHPIPYGECRNHHFHVPVWSQVIIRDVRTLEPMPMGKPGFLQFITPFITSMPMHSVLMGDLASLYAGSQCKCGNESPYFVVHGRAGTSRNKSCAITAAELLRES